MDFHEKNLEDVMKDKKFKRIIGVIQRKDVDLSAAAKTFVSDAAPFLNDGSK